jgi:hypothetical protein
MRILENDVHLIAQLRLFSLDLFCFSQIQHSFPVLFTTFSSLLSVYYCRVYYQFTDALDYMLFSFALSFTETHTPLDHILAVEVCNCHSSIQRYTKG